MNKSLVSTVVATLALSLPLPLSVSAQPKPYLLPEPSLAGKISKAPPPDVHPRVLISPEDLPRLRQLYATTDCGRFLSRALESSVNSCTNGKNSGQADVWRALVAGEPDALTKTTNDWYRARVSANLELVCFYALLTENAELGKQAAAALVTLANISKGEWSITKGAVDNSIGLAYDYVHPFMTDEQRASVRKIIADRTAGRKPHGADLVPSHCNYNWMPDGMRLVLCALAIEGEEGYDPAVYQDSLRVMTNFLDHGIYPSGVPVEEMHYHHYGMTQGALAMVAFAKRGDNLFKHLHYRMLENWKIASIEPYGATFSMHQDSPNDHGGTPPDHFVRKWVWPDDAWVNFSWRNYVKSGYAELGGTSLMTRAYLFPSDAAGLKPYTGKDPYIQAGHNSINYGLSEESGVADFPDITEGVAALNLPLSFMGVERGFLITRDHWGADGLTLHYETNDMPTPQGHYHAEAGSFTLSALRRKWAIDRGMSVCETKDHSLVLIDGRGQGFFPAPGKVIEYREDDGLTVIGSDASYAYHWMIWGNGGGGAVKTFLKGYQFEPDPTPELIKYMAQRTKDHKQRPWEDRTMAGGYPWRAAWNPVKCAFRTAALRRAAVPYVLIADDIQKDEAPHLYEWLMQVPNDLVIVSGGGEKADVVLGNSNSADQRRLLVRMLSVSGSGRWDLEDYEVKRSPETGSDKVFPPGKRLKFSCTTTAPAFRVLLLPYREGAPLPLTKCAGNTLSVSLPGQNDVYDLTERPAGGTTLHLKKSAGGASTPLTR